MLKFEALCDVMLGLLVNSDRLGVYESTRHDIPEDVNLRLHSGVDIHKVIIDVVEL
jgi:hypothetical protein